MRFDHRTRRLNTGRRLLLVVCLLLPAAAVGEVFWSVTDEAGRQNWLLGTMHAEDPRLLEWPTPLVDALREADRMALELVPDGRMIERLQQAMVSREQGLDEALGDELYRRVSKLLENEYGLDESMIRRLKPWAAALTLATQPPKTGLYMDLMLSNRAQGAGLEIVALETVDEQIEFMTGLPREDQISLIRAAVDDHDNDAAIFERMVSAYLDGDLDRLKTLADGEMVGLNARIARHFNEAGLAARNRRMLERAAPWLEAGGLIIAVGALHLHGEEGLVALLEERGWRVEGIY